MVCIEKTNPISIVIGGPRPCYLETEGYYMF